MRWRRVALFAAIVVAHLLIVQFFPTGSAPHEPPDAETSFATLLVPEPVAHQRQSAAAPSRPAETPRVARSVETNGTYRDPISSDHVQPEPAVNTAPSSDWAKEAQLAADNSLVQEAKSSHQAAALSRWRSHVMPVPNVPEKSRFRWDYARTHRVESSGLGLQVNLSDRCSLLISLYMMAIMGGCKIGELPVHGDLFEHMKDAPESSAPADR